jgi:hypothetical protein
MRRFDSDPRLQSSQQLLAEYNFAGIYGASLPARASLNLQVEMNK